MTGRLLLVPTRSVGTLTEWELQTKPGSKNLNSPSPSGFRFSRSPRRFQTGFSVRIAAVVAYWTYVQYETIDIAINV